MLGNFHFNVETSLVLVYCLTCLALLLCLAIPIPPKFKRVITDLISKSFYYLGMAALLPLWTFLNALRNLNRFVTEARDPKFPPLLMDKHKGRVIKMQRNLILGLFAIVCFALLFLFHKVIRRYDEKLEKLQNASARVEAPSSASASSGAADLKQKSKKD